MTRLAALWGPSRAAIFWWLATTAQAVPSGTSYDVPHVPHFTTALAEAGPGEEPWRDDPGGGARLFGVDDDDDAAEAALEPPAPPKRHKRQCAPFPRIVIGCWQLFERHDDPERVLGFLEEYAEANFTTFDAADLYDRAEQILGEFARRTEHDITVFTKYVTQDSAKFLVEQINRRSRRSLGVGALALVQFHWWAFNDHRYIQTAKHLHALEDDGRIAALGACNFDVKRLKRLLVDKRIPLVSNQVQFSLLDRRPENGLLQFAADHGLSILCYGVVAGGFLSDRFRGMSYADVRAIRRADATVSLQTYRASLDAWSGGGEAGWALFQDLLATLRAVADDLAETRRHPEEKRRRPNVATVAIAWVIDRLDATCGGSVVLGIRDATHLDDAVLARDLTLDQTHRDRIDAVLRRGRAPEGDVWSRERVGAPNYDSRGAHI